jgi:hypothetical protein
MSRVGDPERFTFWLGELIQLGIDRGDPALEEGARRVGENVLAELGTEAQATQLLPEPRWLQ